MRGRSGNAERNTLCWLTVLGSLVMHVALALSETFVVDVQRQPREYLEHL